MTIGLDWIINPPVSGLGTQGVELALIFGPNPAALEDTPPVAPRIAVGLVGLAAPNAVAPLAAALRKLTAPGPDGRVVFVGREKTLVDVDRASREPALELSTAILTGSSALLKVAGDAPARLVLVVNCRVDEPIAALLSGATALTERQVGLDIICLHSGADHGLLTRLANLAGGEFIPVDDGQEAADALVTRIGDLRQMTAFNTRIDLEFAPAVRPRALFRLDPTRLFLGNIRLTPDDRRLVLDPGPMRRGMAPRYLLTLEATRRKAGRYRLLEATVHQGEEHNWQATLSQQSSEDSRALSMVEASVGDELQRALPTAWIEDAARAFAEGDARHVSGTLDQLTRHLVCLGHPAVEKVAAMRVHYLRAGVFARPEVNYLRKLAASL